MPGPLCNAYVRRYSIHSTTTPPSVSVSVSVCLFDHSTKGCLVDTREEGRASDGSVVVMRYRERERKSKKEDIKAD